MAVTYTTTLHEFHGGTVLYKGESLRQAIRIARKHDCTSQGQCVAGPTITRSDTGERLGGWERSKPFHRSNEQFWH